MQFFTVHTILFSSYLKNERFFSIVLLAMVGDRRHEGMMASVILCCCRYYVTCIMLANCLVLSSSRTIERGKLLLKKSTCPSSTLKKKKYIKIKSGTQNTFTLTWILKRSWRRIHFFPPPKKIPIFFGAIFNF